jgi:hypothetical protein
MNRAEQQEEDQARQEDETFAAGAALYGDGPDDDRVPSYEGGRRRGTYRTRLSQGFAMAAAGRGGRMTRVRVGQQAGGPSWDQLKGEVHAAGGIVAVALGQTWGQGPEPSDGWAAIFKKRSQARTFVRTVRRQRWNAVVEIQ